MGRPPKAATLEHRVEDLERQNRNLMALVDDANRRVMGKQINNERLLELVATLMKEGR